MRFARRLWQTGLIVCALTASFAPVLASAQTATAPVPGSIPVSIDIPKIGAHAQVVPLGDEVDGAMQSPSDPDTVGWYEPGMGVGVAGNALLDGHVDWGGRLRVFGYLKQLEPGDTVRVTDADGNILSYNVAWSRLYSAEDAPLDEVFEQTGDEEITLITCGGAFDPVLHMYLSRWVVRAIRSPEVSSAD